MLAVLLAVIITILLLAVSCISGTAAVGWSGGTVAGNYIYIGANNGKLVAIDLTSNVTRVTVSDAFTPKVKTNIFGCSPTSGCGGGTLYVPIYGTPVVSGDLVYIAGYNGKIYAFNVADNRTNKLSERWEYPTQSNSFLKPFVGGPVVAQNKLFIGCADGNVYALDAITGDKLASFKTGSKIWGTPAVDGDTLYIGSFDKKVYALNISDLSLKWEYATGGSIITQPLIQDGTVYFGSFDKNLYAVNTADGSLKWKFTGNSWFWAQPQIVNGEIYAGCMDTHVYVLNPATGAKISDFKLDSAAASSPAVSGSYIVFASKKGIIYRIDVNTKKMDSIGNLKLDVDGPLTADNGIVYIHPNSLIMERIEIDTGAVLPIISLQS